MAHHTHLPSFPVLSGYVKKHPDGSYDLTEANQAYGAWKHAYNKAVRGHNKAMKQPAIIRMLTGYRNPDPIPEITNEEGIN